jgi:Spy/CpxP family protein refolding chaperone
MLRKLSLVAAAAASLGAAALAPTSASAWGGHGWHAGNGWHGGCHVRRLVPTPWGARWRLVNRCY